VYVADRPNKRVQVFTVDGTYKSQVFLNRDAMPSAAGLAFSADPGQTRLFVADYGNSQVFTLDRKTLAVLSVFGMRGAAPGLFQGVHSLAADAQGNLYTAEVAPGNRFQKFVRATQLSGARP
jgi:DNA-binding beta-propeller fold protein YncE